MSNDTYGTLSRQSNIRQRDSRAAQPPTKCTFSVAFWIAFVFIILIVILLIILMILYFRKSATQIDPADCPTQVTGILVTPDTKVTTPATSCPSNVSCLYTVSSLSEAKGICQTLGPTKCAAFSINGSNMQVSSSVATTAEVGTNSYRIIQ